MMLRVVLHYYDTVNSSLISRKPVPLHYETSARV